MDYIKDVGTCDRNSMIGSIKYPLVTATVELENNQTELNKGAILGKVTNSGKYKLVNTSAVDGSQIPNCVLAHNVSTGDSTATCYVSGQFNLSKVYIEDNDNILNCIDDLRVVNIYIATEV